MLSLKSICTRIVWDDIVDALIYNSADVLICSRVAIVGCIARIKGTAFARVVMCTNKVVVAADILVA